MKVHSAKAVAAATVAFNAGLLVIVCVGAPQLRAEAGAPRLTFSSDCACTRADPWLRAVGSSPCAPSLAAPGESTIRLHFDTVIAGNDPSGDLQRLRREIRDADLARFLGVAAETIRDAFGLDDLTADIVRPVTSLRTQMVGGCSGVDALIESHPNLLCTTLARCESAYAMSGCDDFLLGGEQPDFYQVCNDVAARCAEESTCALYAADPAARVVEGGTGLLSNLFDSEPYVYLGVRRTPLCYVDMRLDYVATFDSPRIGHSLTLRVLGDCRTRAAEGEPDGSIPRTPTSDQIRRFGEVLTRRVIEEYDARLPETPLLEEGIDGPAVYLTTCSISPGAYGCSSD